MEQFVLKLQIDNLIDNFDEFEQLVNSGYDNFSFVLEDDILTLNMEDIMKYKAFLYLVSDIITSTFINDKKQIEIDVLTELFTKQSGTLPDDSGLYFICNNCPCYQCKQDIELFKRATTSQYLPPWQFCKKSLVEMEISKKIAEELNLPMKISDVDLDDIYWMAKIMNGNNLVLSKEMYKSEKEGKK